MRLFISGSGTGVGKTFFSALLAKHLHGQGMDVSYIKPVQTGYPADDDAAFVKSFSGIKKAKTLFTAEPPLAPCLCFDRFPFEEAAAAVKADDSEIVIVEGAGGIAVPLDYIRMTWEIPKECGLEVIIVIPDRLGCVNEAVLNYSFLMEKGVRFNGFAMNRHFSAAESDSKNSGIIERIIPASIAYFF
ncbi:dethiobiotin synthase [Geovibrio thiophilus]|uniref:dethiobiotin synthase n=1 Tax=Geovibrio thiophilus TaxID=139438 RepID=UPI0013E28C78|nr:dethiobiotin synthase [Geovibrio thiophilus]